jgi:molybdenum cofactor biosynthesis protein MoaC
LTVLDVSHKVRTRRTARAEATLSATPETIARVRNREIPKGDALEVAKVAAVQAAKDTPRIIPYCHPLPIDFVGVEFELGEDFIRIVTTVRATYKTGVEMEALTAASVAALTLYDMLKMFDEAMVISDIRVIEKRGGKSDFREDFAEAPRAVVLVLSDSASAEERSDLSGRLLADKLQAIGFSVEEYAILPDEPEAIAAALRSYADERRVDLVVTTGGTGIGPRDRTPEATAEVLERSIEGIAEAIRDYGREVTPYAMLSRGQAGLRGKTLIINFPGSPSAVTDALDAILPALLHALIMVRGAGHPEADARRERGMP